MRIESPTYFLRLALIIGSGIFFLLLQQGGLDSGVRDRFFWALRPGLSLVQTASDLARSARFTVEFIIEGGRRLAAAEHELSQQRVAQQIVRDLEKENNLLRQELGRPSAEKPMYRLYGGGQNWFIDGGCQHGVKEGAPVLYEGSLVGLIGKVDESFSAVKVLSDRTQRLPVSVGTASAQGIFAASRGAPEIGQLSLRDAVVEGDSVTTLGFGLVPPGLAIGRVSLVQTERNTGTTNVGVELEFLPQEAQWVRVEQEKGNTCQGN